MNVCPKVRKVDPFMSDKTSFTEIYAYNMANQLIELMLYIIHIVFDKARLNQISFHKLTILNAF